MEKKLQRDEQHKMIAGVCAGVADYLHMDITLVRILFLAMLVLHGGGLLLYIVLWIVLPVKSYIFTDPTVNYKVPPSPFGTSPFEGSVPKRRSSGTIIAGTILIIVGLLFLVNEFDIIPDWDFGRLWPVPMIVIGLVLIATRYKKHPWEHDNWHSVNPGKNEENLNDNPPTA